MLIVVVIVVVNRFLCHRFVNNGFLCHHFGNNSFLWIRHRCRCHFFFGAGVSLVTVSPLLLFLCSCRGVLDTVSPLFLLLCGCFKSYGGGFPFFLLLRLLLVVLLPAALFFRCLIFDVVPTV